MGNNNNWNYYALVLTPQGRASLEEVIRRYPNFAEKVGMYSDAIYLHHCTLVHRSTLKTNPQYQEVIARFDELMADPDREYIMTVTHVGMSDKAAAFAVKIASDDLISVNNQPHITICTFNGGRPVDSNRITDWKSIAPRDVAGVLRKCL